MSLYCGSIGRNHRLIANKEIKTVSYGEKAHRIGDGSITSVSDSPEAVDFCMNHCPHPNDGNRCGNCRAFKAFARGLIQKQKNGEKT